MIHDISQRGQRICFAKGGPSGSASAPPATRSPPRPTSPATAQRRRRPGPTSTAPWRKCPRVMLPVRSLNGGGKHETIWNTWNSSKQQDSLSSCKIGFSRIVCCTDIYYIVLQPSVTIIYVFLKVSQSNSHNSSSTALQAKHHWSRQYPLWTWLVW